VTSPVVTAVLVVVGGIGLMALVIAEGLAGHFRQNNHEQANVVASARTNQRDRGASRVTVWELRRREHADSLAYYPSPFRRADPAGREPTKPPRVDWARVSGGARCSP
jgi:hypothetical protein